MMDKVSFVRIKVLWVGLLQFVVQISIALTTKIHRDSDTYLLIDGKVVESQNYVLLMISCISDTMPFECAMEVLRANLTIASMRYSERRCYDTNGNPGICSCTEESTSFHWNITTSSVQTNEIFGCSMRIHNITSNSYYKVHTLAFYNGTDFNASTLFINQINTVQNHLRQTPRNSTLDWTMIGILVASSFTVLVCLALCLKHVRKKRGILVALSFTTLACLALCLQHVPQKKAVTEEIIAVAIENQNDCSEIIAPLLPGDTSKSTDLEMNDICNS